MLARLRSGDMPAEGEWLVAERQSAGKGRQGRAWSDGFGNFMGSTVVYLNGGDPPAHTLSLVAGVALHDTVRPFVDAGHTLHLKWPNDLLLGGAKLSGILLEREGQGVVVGIGVNLAQAPQLPDRATACLAQLGPAPAPQAFAEALAEHMRATVATWRSAGFETIRQRWLAAAHPQGTSITVHDEGRQTISGAFAGLSQDGALLLLDADGMVQTVHAGDVTLG